MLDIQPADCRVLVTAAVPQEWHLRVHQAASGGKVVITQDEEEITRALQDTTIWYARRLSADMIEQAPDLQWCHVGQTGVERLPLETLKRRGVILTNGRGLQAPAVADHAMALILAWARQIHHAVRMQGERRWDRTECAQLSRSTILIIGLGAIGRELARRTAGFGMRIMGVTRRPRAVPYVDDVVGPEGLPQVLPEADYVVLACPLTQETRHIIGSKELVAMKRSSYLVNVGRGGLIDEPALIAALKSGSIAGAGLDVFETEPLPADSELWAMDSVIMTPHTGGSRQKAQEEATLFFLENLHRHLSGRPLMNIVDLDQGY